MITNPNTLRAKADAARRVLREIEEDKDEDFLDKRGAIKVRRLTKYDDPQRFDRAFESVVREVETSVVGLDVRIMEKGDDGKTRLVRYTNPQDFLRSPDVQRRLSEARNRGLLDAAEEKDARLQLERRSLSSTLQARRLKEGHDFEYGYYPDERPYNGRVFPITDVALPSLNSPHSKNALFVDYLDAHRKCWEAATFNPIAKRIVKIIPQFVLGRGVKGSISSKDHQQAWDSFWKRNRMRQRIKQTLREIVTYGEVFWRYFETPEGLLVRSLDPSTIWDIITDEDDIENVKYYHQQYVRLDQSPVPGRVPIPSTIVIRHIPAEQVSHYKINSTSSEKRGRSELFPILGYLLRFKEFVNDRVLLNKMRAMFALDVSVGGTAEDVSNAEEQFQEPPGPAAVLVHNSEVAVEFKNASANANDAQTDAETLLKVIAIGAGVSENFLGVSRQQTRAGALISTEPDVKNFEDYQELIEDMLMDSAERVFLDGKLSVEAMEFTFPAIAQEDRSAKIKDIALMESMDYFSKRRSATMAAREFQITDYHYEDEQQRVRQERGDEPMIASPFQQVTKIAPVEGGDGPPGLGADLTKPDPDRVTQTSGQMGFKDDLGGRSLANTQATLNRPGFTRGGERLAIKNRRSSGTPLRQASGEPPRKSGWSDEARAKSLATRRARAEARKREQAIAE